MADVVFFGLPTCPANARQKQQLKAAGHTVSERDLAQELLTRDTLRAFFGERPVEDWFNRRAAAVKRGTIDPATVGADGALDAMLADRELIRRPLLQVGDRREAGFDPNTIHAWIGLAPGGETCDDKHARGVCDHGHQNFPKRA